MSLARLALPPRIKVLEALGALADGRVRRLGEKLFSVSSSDGARTYTVYLEKVGAKEFVACSTDNGTVHRGYVGYPIISVMMLLGYLPRDLRVERALAGIPWRRLNETLKRYSLVESEVVKVASSRGVSPSSVYAALSKVMEELGRVSVLFERSACGGTVADEESPG